MSFQPRREHVSARLVVVEGGLSLKPLEVYLKSFPLIQQEDLPKMTSKYKILI